MAMFGTPITFVHSTTRKRDYWGQIAADAESNTSSWTLFTLTVTTLTWRGFSTSDVTGRTVRQIRFCARICPCPPTRPLFHNRSRLFDGSESTIYIIKCKNRNCFRDHISQLRSILLFISVRFVVVLVTVSCFSDHLRRRTRLLERVRFCALILYFVKK